MKETVKVTELETIVEITDPDSITGISPAFYDYLYEMGVHTVLRIINNTPYTTHAYFVCYWAPDKRLIVCLPGVLVGPPVDDQHGKDYWTPIVSKLYEWRRGQAWSEWFRAGFSDEWECELYAVDENGIHDDKAVIAVNNFK